jgi:hypothetical protein
MYIAGAGLVLQAPLLMPSKRGLSRCRLTVSAREGLVIATSNLLQPGDISISLLPSLIEAREARTGLDQSKPRGRSAVAQETRLVCCTVPLAAPHLTVLLVEVPDQQLAARCAAPLMHALRAISFNRSKI